MLGDNIKRYRTSCGMTQEALAGRLNVVRQTVSKWEKGMSLPDAEMLVHLAAALGTDVETLLGDADAGTSPMSTEEQLARINGHLAIKNSQARRFRIAVAVIAGAILLLSLLSIIVSAVVNRTYTFERDKVDVYTYELETVEN